MKKLLPIILLLIGSGAGVGAGIYLRPTTDIEAETKIDGHSDKKEKSEKHDDGKGEKDKALEYVKMSNQFVIPIVRDRVVTSLVVLSISLEVPEGTKEAVFKKEPKVRNSFLQIMFDHANLGGFDGSFTDASMLSQLRMALLEVAKRDLGKEAVQEVLILEIARQDY